MRRQWRFLLITFVMVASMTVAHQVTALFGVLALLGLVALGVMFLVFGLKFNFKQPFTKIIFLLAATSCLTIAYTQTRAAYRLHEAVPKNWIGQVLTVQGSIETLPTRTPFGVRFVFSPTTTQVDSQVQNALKMGVLPHHISTGWYEASLPVTGIEGLHVGQVWRLPLAFKPPHATQNQGVFDQEQDWFARDMRGTATVKVNSNTLPDAHPKLISTNVWGIVERMRESALRKIERGLAITDEPDAQATALFKALTFGEQSEISNTQWAVFQQTGVTHLVSISGVHITMLAALAVWCVKGLWRLSPRLCEFMPALYAAQWAGLAVALGYALLAGWQIPAQRTVVMLAIWLCLSRLGVASSGVRVLCFALWAVLLFDPFAVMSIGFWLSFGAVAWLMMAFEVFVRDDVATAHKWLSFVGTQLAIGLALLPATLYFFHQASLLGVAVNFVAIPLVSGVVTPLLLVACVLNFVFGWTLPLVWAHALLVKGNAALAWLVAMFPQAVWVETLTWWQAMLLAGLSLSFVWAVRLRVWRRTMVLVACMLCVFSIPRPKNTIENDQVRVHVIDIGQGSAILLQTASQNWLFDTGPKYGEDSDAGGRIIAPYLREIGVDTIDTMIISHNDIDHSGGAASVAAMIKVKRVLTSIDRERLNAKSIRADEFGACLAGQSWLIDGVKFDMLSPTPDVLADASFVENQRSCVLRVESAVGDWRSLMLTGDLDFLMEARLAVSKDGSNGGIEPLHTDIVMMPHHGSVHGSSTPFIESTSPRIAIAQSGYLNRYGHPHPLTLQRYQDAKVQIANTVDAGAVRFCLGCSDLKWSEWRDEGRRYFWDQKPTN